MQGGEVTNLGSDTLNEALGEKVERRIPPLFDFLTRTMIIIRALINCRETECDVERFYNCWETLEICFGDILTPQLKSHQWIGRPWLSYHRLGSCRMTVSITPALLLLLKPQLGATTIVFFIFPTSQNTSISILFKTVLHSVPTGLPSEDWLFKQAYKWIGQGSIEFGIVLAGQGG